MCMYSLSLPERPMHSNEKVLGAQTGLNTDSFFCIKPNSFADMLEHQVSMCTHNMYLEPTQKEIGMK